MGPLAVECGGSGGLGATFWLGGSGWCGCGVLSWANSGYFLAIFK